MVTGLWMVWQVLLAPLHDEQWLVWQMRHFHVAAGWMNAGWPRKWGSWAVSWLRCLAMALSEGQEYL
jgi:hypothetical protein